METQFFTPSAQEASLIVLENNRIQVYPLEQRTEWRIGRIDPAAGIYPDIQLTSKLVSRKHGRLRKIQNSWYYEDHPNNLNGTFYNAAKISRQVQSLVQLRDRDILRIDNEDLQDVHEEGVLFLFTTQKIKGEWTLLPLCTDSLTIGRSPECELTEDAPYISSYHAVISRENGQYELTDCGNLAGTFLNGKKVQQKERLKLRDCISICDRNYFFLGDKLLYVMQDYRTEYEKLPHMAPEDRQVLL